MSIKRILFVCLGNICRSPAADGVMRAKVAEAALDIEVDSAGIGAWHVGDLPDRRMRECGHNHGFRFDHRARQVQVADFDRFDLIVGMDNQNLRDLENLAPSDEAKSKIVCLADFLSRHPGQLSIPDPYYGDMSDFEFALELIDDATDGLLSSLGR